MKTTSLKIADFLLMPFLMTYAIGHLTHTAIKSVGMTGFIKGVGKELKERYMSARVPKKNDIVMLHLDDGDFMAICVDTGYTVSSTGDFNARNVKFRVPMRSSAIAVIPYWEVLEKIDQGQIKILETNEVNIEKPKYECGDLLIRSAENEIVSLAYIRRSFVKGHETKLPDDSYQHCQFWYDIIFPERVGNFFGEKSQISRSAKLRETDVPEALIDYGIKKGTIIVKPRKGHSIANNI